MPFKYIVYLFSLNNKKISIIYYYFFFYERFAFATKETPTQKWVYMQLQCLLMTSTMFRILLIDIILSNDSQLELQWTKICFLVSWQIVLSFHLLQKYKIYCLNILMFKNVLSIVEQNNGQITSNFCETYGSRFLQGF